jgi:hypothetical protein
MNEQKVYLLNKLIALYHRDPEVLRALTFLANRPDEYQAEMLHIENMLMSSNIQVDETGRSAIVLSTIEGSHIFDALTRSVLLRQLFVPDWLPFSEAPPEQVEVFAQFADVTPDSQTMLYSQSHNFMRALYEIGQPGLIDAKSWLIADIVKFLSFYDEQRPMAYELFSLACSAYWAPVLRALEDVQNGVQQSAKLSVSVANFLEKLQAVLTPELYSVLFAPPHPLTISKELIELGWKNWVDDNGRTVVDDAQLKLDIMIEQKETMLERRKHIAATVMDLLFHQYGKEIQAIVGEIELYIEAAQHLVAVRKFAKLDAFVYGWPEIATIAMGDYVSLEDVERFIVQGSSTEPKLFFSPRAWPLYERVAHAVRYDVLRKFFHLRPFFHEINEDELVQYRPAPPIVINEKEASESTNLIGSQLPGQLSSDQQASTTYQNVTLRVEKVTEFNSEETRSATLVVSHRVAIVSSSLNPVQADIALSIPSLFTTIDNLLGMPLQKVGEAYQDDMTLKGMGNQLSDRLIQVGKEIVKMIVVGTNLEAFERLLKSGIRTRVILQSDDPELISLPWEWITVPDRDNFLSKDRSYSFVRTLPDLPIRSARRIELPLRIMFLSLNSLGALSSTVNSITNSVDRVLASHSGFVSKIITGEQTTFSDFSRQLIEFDPHIIHIEIDAGTILGGSSVVANKSALPVSTSLPFTGESGGINWVASSMFSDMLSKTNISLLVFGSNSLMVTFQASLVQLTIEFLRNGLPAAIVPMRGIDEVSAHMFTKELYYSLVQGHPLEIAIVNARSAVSFARRNWSAFALFVNERTLDIFSSPAV